MKLERPINIFFETLIYISSMAFLIYASWNNLLNREMARKIWDSWMWIGFFTMVTVITVRAMVKAEAKRFVSTFYFGFASGVFIWTFFVIVEPGSGGIIRFLQAIISILGVGVLMGLLASVWSYLVFWVLKKLNMAKERP